LKVAVFRNDVQLMIGE